jgi:hypothetical protein
MELLQTPTKITRRKKVVETTAKRAEEKALRYTTNLMMTMIKIITIKRRKKEIPIKGENSVGVETTKTSTNRRGTVKMPNCPEESRKKV